jgi:leucyl/phenylalanyl-tRNA--protein transferase
MVRIAWLDRGDDFPDPRRLRIVDGLVAASERLSVGRVLSAYRSGAFPWYEEDGPVLWWCPDPRCVITPDSLHVSRRLLRTLRRELPDGDRGPRLRLTWDRAFDAVMAACGEREEGSWIFADMQRTYGALARLGHAHSLEVWRGEELVGGLYGVRVGGLFAAESMFHRERDMSKVALVAALRSAWRAGVRLFDVQFLTEHLASLGAFEISRSDYLARLADVVDMPGSIGVAAPDWRPIEEPGVSS